MWTCLKVADSYVPVKSEVVLEPSTFIRLHLQRKIKIKTWICSAKVCISWDQTRCWDLSQQKGNLELNGYTCTGKHVCTQSMNDRIILSCWYRKFFFSDSGLGSTISSSKIPREYFMKYFSQLINYKIYNNRDQLLFIKIISFLLVTDLSHWTSEGLQLDISSIDRCGATLCFGYIKFVVYVIINQARLIPATLLNCYEMLFPGFMLGSCSGGFLVSSMHAAF